MDAALLRSLWYISAALALVLLARRPARQAFGAGPAFSLWLLPALALVLPCLPELPAGWSVLPSIRVLPGAIAVGMPAADATVSMPWLRWLWLAGTAAMLLRLGVHYVRLRRQARALPASMAASLPQLLDGFDLHRLRLHASGPAVLWAPRSLLLLPADFLDRFDATGQRLVLRHELTHLRRGDALWSLAAELMLALLWFHPLAWLARPRFRLDQELACDERVLRHTPRDEAGYAQALLHSVDLSAAPALIPWFAEPQLKERLSMIQRHRPGALRRRAGYAALAVLMAGSVFVAQAATGNPPHQTAGQDLSYNSRLYPKYPAAAIKAGEQGTVMLKVQVLADGSVGSIAYEPEHSTTTSADLIAAATDAARQWRFNPETKDGKPVDGYVRVPVAFDLHPPPSPADDVEKSNSKLQKVF
ncbi:M56 family metallopeptidase [Dyella agri]|uniref:M56 family metallopeptidase n=1 Tax=Dyella agri TaxID=1926869 RepID=A0ABW8KFY7_9GAMM